MKVTLSDNIEYIVERWEFSYTVETQWVRSVDNKIHRNVGPAFIIKYSDGTATKKWYQEGKLHRTDGPAIEYFDGGKRWYQHGKLHRVGRPAVEHANGNKEWWQEGEFLVMEIR